MLVPIDRPIIDARSLAAAATQTVSAGFVATHDQKSVLLLTGDAADRTSDGTTPIQVGVTNGQVLTIVAVATNTNGITIQDAGNCVLNGNWYVFDGTPLGSSLTVVWDSGTAKWYEVNRQIGGNVASGLASHAEGRTSTASGNYTHAEGYSNIASAQSSHAEGQGNNVSGNRSHVEGYGNTVTGWDAHAEGDSNTASGGDAHVEGKDCEVSAYSGHASGSSSLASLYSEYAHASGKFASRGDAQYSRYVARRAATHSAANWYTLFLDGADDLLTIPANTVFNFRVQLVGKNDADTKRFAFNITGAIARDGANNTSILGTPTVTAVYGADDTDFEAQAVADDTNEALLIQVRDTTSGGDLIRWVATIEVTSVTY